MINNIENIIKGAIIGNKPENIVNECIYISCPLNWIKAGTKIVKWNSKYARKSRKKTNSRYYYKNYYLIKVCYLASKDTYFATFKSLKY